MVQDGTAKIWHPDRFTQVGMGTDGKTVWPDLNTQYAVIILNNPLENKNLLIDICFDSRWRVCADGGANRLNDLEFAGMDEFNCLPGAICGDLDSLRPEVEEHYRSQGVKIIKDPDQYATDLTKCLKYIRDRLAETEEKFKYPERGVDVAIFGSLGGRADQAFSQLHHLYTCSQDVPSMIGNLYLITAESVIFLLEKGKNRIHAPVGPTHFTENVGIIPIGRPSVITTRGLEWDVSDWSTEFGTQISTSNHIRADIVEVETSERVLFTHEFAKQPGMKAGSPEAIVLVGRSSCLQKHLSEID